MGEKRKNSREKAHSMYTEQKMLREFYNTEHRLLSNHNKRQPFQNSELFCDAKKMQRRNSNATNENVD